MGVFGSVARDSVMWNDISEARTIVECAIPGFRIEPSQGTHFFQNITSLGVGYLTVDTVSDPSAVNSGLIKVLKSIKKGKYTELFLSDKPIAAYIDRKNGKAVVGLQA